MGGILLYGIFIRIYTSDEKFNKSIKFFAFIQNDKVGYPSSNVYHSTFLSRPEAVSRRIFLNSIKTT
jgi:hypothetical protein